MSDTTTTQEKPPTLGFEASGDFAEITKYADQFLIFSEREDEVRMLLFAILMGEHVLFEGRPGTAKSEMSRKFLSNIKNCNVFKTQFTAFMGEEYVFGPQLFEDYKNGIVRHNITKMLPEAHLAFLDEFFNANGQVISSCLEIFNERTFTRNGQEVECPLVTAVLTTNRDRTDETELDAIYDRILFRAKVQKVAKDDNRTKMYLNAFQHKFDNFNPLDFAVLERARAKINGTVKCSIGIMESYSRLIAGFEKESDAYISDRTAIKGITLLKVVAMLKDEKRIELDMFGELRLIFCNVGDANQLAQFDSVFNTIKKDNEHLEREVKLLKDIESTFDGAKTALGNAQKYSDYKKLRMSASDLMKKIKTETTNFRRDSKDTVNGIQEELDDMITGVDHKITDMQAQKNPDAMKDTEWFTKMRRKGTGK